MFFKLSCERRFSTRRKFGLIPQRPAVKDRLCHNLDPVRQIALGSGEGVVFWIAVRLVWRCSWRPHGGASAQNTEEAPAFSAAEMHVRLLAPLTTKLNRKGDMVPARIVEPAALQSGILEGDIREIRAGGTKRSIIEFQFHTLHLSGSRLPISATLLRLSLSNSKRQSGSDEDGSPIDTGQAEENSKRLPLFRKLGGQGEKSSSHSASVV